MHYQNIKERIFLTNSSQSSIFTSPSVENDDWGSANAIKKINVKYGSGRKTNPYTCSIT